MGAQADAVREDFDAFRTLVRTVAIRVAKEQGWCDAGLNEVLRELGLNPKQNFQVPVEVTFTRQFDLTVSDAESLEDARRQLRERDAVELARQYGYSNIVSASVVEPPAPTPPGQAPSVGDAKPAYGEFHSPSALDRQCLARDESGVNWCTRDRAHESPHVASDSRRVLAVWEGNGLRAGIETPDYSGAGVSRGYDEDDDDDEDDD